MSQQLIQQTIRRAYWIPAWQFFVTAIASGIWALYTTFNEGISVFLGGFISFMPMCYLAFRLFSLSGARQSKQILMRFYRAEIMKLFLTCLLFIAFLRYGYVSPLPFIFGFFCAQISALFTPVLYWLDYKRQRSKSL